jgi:antirestriction protein
MKIYIANLAKYNEGGLIGEWIELKKNIDLHKEIEKICGGDEWAIHDYELPFKIDEHESIDALQDLANADLSNYEMASLINLIDNCGESLENALAKYENYAVYQADSWEDLAEQFVNEGVYGEIPESLQSYIDYEAIGRDLNYDYDEVEYDDVIYFVSKN